MNLLELLTALSIVAAVSGGTLKLADQATKSTEELLEMHDQYYLKLCRVSDDACNDLPKTSGEVRHDD